MTLVPCQNPVSAGWLSEIENNSGTSKLTEKEFERIVDILGGTQHRAMFRTWVASYKRQERLDQTFDGAVLKFIRVKQKLSLKLAAKATGISTTQISKIETGVKKVPPEVRNRIMVGYGYSPSSFKNLSTDPIRSKSVPLIYKLTIILNRLGENQIEKVFDYVKNFLEDTDESGA